MTDWHSPEQLLKDKDALYGIVAACAGICVWDILCTTKFEMRLIRGKVQLQWPLAIYYLNRAALMMALIALLAMLKSRSEIDCQGALITVVVGAMIMSSCSSGIFTLRALALWKGNAVVVALLFVLLLGQLALWAWNISLPTAVWVPSQQMCSITTINWSATLAAVAYTVFYDAFVTVVTMYRLIYGRTGRSSHFSGVQALLIRDGMGYFLVVLLLNILTLVFEILNLNSLMNLVTMVPQFTFSVILSCRAMVDLRCYGLDNGLDRSTTRSRAVSVALGAVSTSRLPPGQITIVKQQEVDFDLDGEGERNGYWDRKFAYVPSDADASDLELVGTGVSRGWDDPSKAC